MSAIIGILVEQQPSKIGVHERNCVTESVMLSVRIVAKDLEVQTNRKGVCLLLPALQHAFNKKKAFYKGTKGASWNVNHHHHMVGVPEVRVKALERFGQEKGFHLLYVYLQQRLDLREDFPPLNLIQELLANAGDAVHQRNNTGTTKDVEEEIILLCKSVMSYISSLSDDGLKRIPTEELAVVQQNLMRIFDRAVVSRRASTYEFYAFWRSMVMQLITSKSLPLKLFGWEQVGQIIQACEAHRPPPKGFVVSAAGTTFLNGTYVFAGEVTPDGYARLGTEFIYVLDIPAEGENAAKKLTLFRCTMRSQQKWWFLSEADEEQPGTDRDIDYYQNKAKDFTEPYPPATGWITCRNAGTDPPPVMEAQGVLVPAGAEFDTLEHELAKWAIENEIVEQVLGDTTIHREVVSRSTVLIKFLAYMCSRVAEPGSKYCLQASHLLFAWKTCTRKADAAVSLQVYQLLVSILPQCPSNLSIPLLQAVQTSLRESDEKRDYLLEVSEFCSALADGSICDAKGSRSLSEDVRQEILDLLWSVVTHPEATSLKSYDSLKQYLTFELKVEPKGKEHRERFLHICVDKLNENRAVSRAAVNEDQALRSVKLLQFVLEACPVDQAQKISSQESLALPSLIFHELVAYLDRRANCSAAQVLDEAAHSVAMQERLRILRHVYGLSVGTMGSEAIQELWGKCSLPSDREAVMAFIADASQTAPIPGHDVQRPVNQPQQANDDVLTPALTIDDCHAIFLNLYCSTTLDYCLLGESAYRSFQFLFNRVRHAGASSGSKTTALDALWRLFLTVGKDSVANQAMRDLLAVYASRHKPQNGVAGIDAMATDDNEDSFDDKIFDNLSRLKDSLRQGDAAAELSAKRCLLILKAAMGEDTQDPLATTSTLSRLSLLGPDSSFDETIRCLPHGLRGQASYRRIGVVARGSNQRTISPTKFQLDVHPLETLGSLKAKLAASCQCAFSSVKLVQINGRAAGRSANGDSSSFNLSALPDDTVMDELGIVQGCEVVVVVSERQKNTAAPVSQTSTTTTRTSYLSDLSNSFFDPDGKFSERLFSLVMGILEVLPVAPVRMEVEGDDQPIQKLAWDLLLAMPTNTFVAKKVQPNAVDDPMEIDPTGESWLQLLDAKAFDRSVYVLMTIDAYLQPAPEAISILPEQRLAEHKKVLLERGTQFRRNFVDAGGFAAVVRFFSTGGHPDNYQQGKMRRGNAVALRILKSCLLGSNRDAPNSDEMGTQLLQSLTTFDELLKSLTAMVVHDTGISSSTVSDVLTFLALLFQSDRATQTFVRLKDAERFFVALLLWDGGNKEKRTSLTVSALHVRRSARDLVLQNLVLLDSALPWLVKAVEGIDTTLDSTAEFFDALEKVIENDSSQMSSQARSISDNGLKDLGLSVCRKLVLYPRPTSETDALDLSTGVLCGCLKLLRALIEKGGGKVLREASMGLLADLKIQDRWSASGGKDASRGMLSIVTAPFPSRSHADDAALVDIMGVIFDGFLSPNQNSGLAICCDKESRRRGFDVVAAAAKSCESSIGYTALVSRVNGLVASISPRLRNRWGQFGGSADSRAKGRGSSKFSGLRNQGCTCYMNSFLQQLFMMPELRDSLCSAPLPSSLRTAGVAKAVSGADLVGKKISLQWDNGVSYEAHVDAFNEVTGMHRITYLPIHIATPMGSNPQAQSEDITCLPTALPDEFILSEGRPGKETGVYEVLLGEKGEEGPLTSNAAESVIKETEDECSSRRLLEEVQRTFIHLKEGSKGRCYDPRSLVEACACLKLEFDVWQQNDASEFATKLLDRLEISLKKWAPSNFDYMDHTFGLKQTKQKICKKCGLKTNREEKLLNIDCQIRGKSDIHEALDSMTEVEIMEGSNQVYCDNCKENTDTVLRTAISTFPNMLILSLKRFDLDFTTFETVKLNSRCAFGQTLNMKEYSLECLEANEINATSQERSGATPMETEDAGTLPDEDYEYRLVGVLVHAGVAQGGHYYSFIKERSPVDDSKEHWYRFDDEDVTPFDPTLIETECFGGKVKKETKWPSGQVQTVEQEQFANALMLFYEKVKPSEVVLEQSDKRKEPMEQVLPAGTKKSSGFDAFQPDVLRSNSIHRWQSFLFDSEFQSFMKGLLGYCRLTVAEQKNAPSDTRSPWLEPMTDMIVTFLFDVMLYSSDLSALSEWIRLLEELLRTDRPSAVALVHSLAKRTQLVSANWLRVYLLDCPDKTLRSSAVRVFSAATITYALSGSEASILPAWAQAWREQVEDFGLMREEVRQMPCRLEGKWQSHENIDKIGNGSSSLGIILSFLNVLLDAIPRCWRFHSETCAYIRDLAKATLDGKKSPFHRPMINAMIPARLVALVVRERAPTVLKNSFPATSLSQDMANMLGKPESNPISHMGMGMVPADSVMSTTEGNNQRGPSSTDYLVIFEALACIGGLAVVYHEPLIQAADEIGRNRPRHALTEKATQALKVLFDENSAPDSPGMGKLDIERYLERCGSDRSASSPQKVHEILSKYGTNEEESAAGGALWLNFDGFLAFYRDVVQSNDTRLRHDLHVHGFRPNLSRRSKDARMLLVAERDGSRLTPRGLTESVAVDVAEMLHDRRFDVGTVATMVLTSAMHFHSVAITFSEPVMTYLVAASIYGKDAEPLINRTLQTIYSTPNDWAGNERVNGSTVILQAIACTPGEHQEANISKIMLSNVQPIRSVSFGAGLLEVTKALSGMSRSNQYSDDVYLHMSRYTTVLRELYQCYPIHQWMNQNRQLWSFLARELFDQRTGQQQHSLRRDVIELDTIPVDHTTQSDSDMAGMNDSEDEDDSHFDNVDGPLGPVDTEGPAHVVVSGAGNPAVNGTYQQDGVFSGACRYSKAGLWKSKDCRFFIFQCNVSNNTRHWYISIVPPGMNPGTSSDIDFYTAPATERCTKIPPQSGWAKSNEGRDPSPNMEYRFYGEENARPIVEDDSDDQQQHAYV